MQSKREFFRRHTEDSLKDTALCSRGSCDFGFVALSVQMAMICKTGKLNFIFNFIAL